MANCHENRKRCCRRFKRAVTRRKERRFLCDRLKAKAIENGHTGLSLIYVDMLYYDKDLSNKWLRDQYDIQIQTLGNYRR